MMLFLLYLTWRDWDKPPEELLQRPICSDIVYECYSLFACFVAITIVTYAYSFLMVQLHDPDCSKWVIHEGGSSHLWIMMQVMGYFSYIFTFVVLLICISVLCLLSFVLSQFVLGDPRTWSFLGESANYTE